MPTDAECVALPAPRLPASFGPGEQLEYDVDAMGAKAAKMTMRVLPVKDAQLPVEIAVETNTFFSKVRRVKGTGTTYLDPKTLKPKRYLEDATENEVHRVADVRFRPKAARLTSTIDGRQAEAELAYSADGLDVAGAIFMIRQLPLKEGTKVCFDAYGIRRMWRVWGTVGKKEHVSLAVGEFDTWHLVGETAPLTLPNARRQLHVWISDDPRRLPLAALGTIDVGAVRATLTGFSRPGDKKAKAEPKGNLTW